LAKLFWAKNKLKRIVAEKLKEANLHEKMIVTQNCLDQTELYYLILSKKNPVKVSPKIDKFSSKRTIGKMMDF
jgi:hypothetical protein